MKKNVAVIMGGYSSEIEISMQSGQVVVDSLDKEKYTVFSVHILKNKWVVVLNDIEININKNDFSFTNNGKKIEFDVVFNAIHGDPGENGRLISYFELLGIKHTSADFYAMALTFNKRDTLSVLKEYGVKCAKSIYVNKGDEIDFENIVNTLKLPCFVKPNNAGSSYGITKVTKKEQLKDAIDYAFEEDNEILIESFLDGTEVTVGVVELNEKVEVLPMTEIVTENDFFDYEAKYEGESNEITPARISKEEEQKLTKTSLKIYAVLNMKGLSRSDFILVNGEPYFIEINTVPGLSPMSLIPQQAKKAGYDLKTFFGLIVETVLKNN